MDRSLFEQMKPSSHDVYFSLGSNVGHRLQHLWHAWEVFKHVFGEGYVRVSSIYESSAVDYADQANFYNCCIRVHTTFSPRQCLNVCHLIEGHMGATKPFPKGPRIMDVDLLLHGHAVIKEGHAPVSLIVPHAAMCDRLFVLWPLLEIEPFLCMPNGTPLNHHLKQPSQFTDQFISKTHPPFDQKYRFDMDSACKAMLHYTTMKS